MVRVEVKALTVHEVRRGDTLWRIAVRYGVTPQALREANELAGLAVSADSRLVIAPPAISRGSRGRAVRELQRLLRRAGYEPGPVDGDFGSATAAALETFCRTAGAELSPVDPEAEEAPPVPVVTPRLWGILWRAAQARVPPGAKVHVAATQAVLRFGPGEDRRPLRVLPFGLQLLVLRSTGRWLQVATPERHRGWLRQELVAQAERAGL